MKKTVALSYPAGAEAPFIVAAGKGLLAQRILDLAGVLNIHIEENAAVADVLSLYDIGSYIPEETYEAIARVFAFLKKVDTENGKNTK